MQCFYLGHLIHKTFSAAISHFHHCKIGVEKHQSNGDVGEFKSVPVNCQLWVVSLTMLLSTVSSWLDAGVDVGPQVNLFLIKVLVGYFEPDEEMISSHWKGTQMTSQMLPGLFRAVNLAVFVFDWATSCLLSCITADALLMLGTANLWFCLFHLGVHDNFPNAASLDAAIGKQFGTKSLPSISWDVGCWLQHLQCHCLDLGIYLRMWN